MTLSSYKVLQYFFTLKKKFNARDVLFYLFVPVQDIELGDSPVLCVSVVGKRVWLGLEAGVLVVYDANSRKPYLQV